MPIAAAADAAAHNSTALLLSPYPLHHVGPSQCIFCAPLLSLSILHILWHAWIDLTPWLGICLIKLMRSPRTRLAARLPAPVQPVCRARAAKNICEKPLALFKMQRNAALEMQSMWIKFPACSQRNCSQSTSVEWPTTNQQQVKCSLGWARCGRGQLHVWAVDHLRVAVPPRSHLFFSFFLFLMGYWGCEVAAKMLHKNSWAAGQLGRQFNWAWNMRHHSKSSSSCKCITLAMRYTTLFFFSLSY